jgi:predicted N-acetyltransferase YhbS
LEQHWRLGPVGVLPSHQGKGIGTTLLNRFCKEVDACLTPVYLETDTDKNVRFYERFGFQVVEETDIFMSLWGRAGNFL